MIRFLFVLTLLPLFCINSASLSHEDLTWTNRIAYHVAKTEGKLGPLEESLFKVYLAEAQLDFAKRTNLNGSFIPVTQGLIALFYPDALVPEYEEKGVDQWSAQMAAPIIENYTQRLTKEGQSLKNYPLKTGQNFWRPSCEPFGQNYGSVLIWNGLSVNDFNDSRPNLDTSFLQKEAFQVKEAMKGLDQKKLTTIAFWTHQADWEKFAEQYIKKNHLALFTRLEVRAALLSALIDAQTAAYHVKYTYFAPRPDQVDNSIFAAVEVPSSPGYPSLISTQAKAAAVVLGGYFPEGNPRWNHLAEEAGQVSIWSGRSFPQDHFGGKSIGEKVGLKALENHKSK